MPSAYPGAPPSAYAPPAASAPPSPFASRASEPDAPPARRCAYCCMAVPVDARKCRACGEWLVPTSGGLAAGLLRALGWTWAGVSTLAAAVLWYLGGAVRQAMLLGDADRWLTPLGLDVARWGLVALVALQGITIAVVLHVLAGLAPRRLPWWRRAGPG